MKTKKISDTDNTVTFVWDTVEGGKYGVDVSADLKTWFNGTVNFTADSTEHSSFYSKPNSGNDRFYRLIRIGIEDFDNVGFADEFGDSP